MIEDLFLTVLFVVGLYRPFRVLSGMKCVSAGRVNVMRRLFRDVPLRNVWPLRHDGEPHGYDVLTRAYDGLQPSLT